MGVVANIFYLDRGYNVKEIATYSKYLPTIENAFFYKVKEGSVYQVGCWINESTKVRLK